MDKKITKKTKYIDAFDKDVVRFLTGVGKDLTREQQAKFLSKEGWVSRTGKELSASHIANLGKINPTLRIQPKHEKPSYAGKNHIVCNKEKKLKEELKIHEAVDTVRGNLINDQGYRISWKANIAMSFVDEFKREQESIPLKVDYAFLHKVANNAAENFLMLLCK